MAMFNTRLPLTRCNINRKSWREGVSRYAKDFDAGAGDMDQDRSVQPCNDRVSGEGLSMLSPDGESNGFGCEGHGSRIAAADWTRPVYDRARLTALVISGKQRCLHTAFHDTFVPPIRCPEHNISQFNCHSLSANMNRRAASAVNLVWEVSGPQVTNFCMAHNLHSLDSARERTPFSDAQVCFRKPLDVYTDMSC